MATSASHTPILRVPSHLEPLIQEERTRCTSLGLQLKIPHAVLQDLEKKSKVKKSIRECFLEMWQQWFKDKGERKWIDIFEPLKQQRHNRLKNILEKKYKADTPVQEDFNFEGELKEMIPKWYQFGCALGVSTTDMDIIKAGEGGSEVYMISMLKEWNENHEDSYTWETLQEALRVIGNNRLATNLEEHRLKDKQVGVSKLQEPSTVKQSEPDISADESDESDDRSSQHVPPPSGLPRKRHGLSGGSPTKIDGQQTAVTHGSKPSMLNLCIIVLTCVLIVAGVALLIFLSTYNLKTKNVKDSSTFDPDQKTVKPPATNECHKIDQSIDVYLYLKQEDFSITSTKEFGLYLKLTNSELDNLKDESGGKGAEFLNKVVDMWYKKAPPPACWETIYDALWKVPNRPLADKVKKEYMKD